MAGEMEYFNLSDSTDSYTKHKSCDGFLNVTQEINNTNTISTSDAANNDNDSDYFCSDDDNEEDSEDDYKISSFKCPKCEEEKPNRTDFIEHLKLHAGKLKTCTDCQKQFPNSLCFKYHKRLKMCLKSSKMFKCKLCNKRVFGESQIKEHMRAHKRNQCKICGDHFAKRKHLETHSTNIHKVSAEKELFRCHLCERTFSQRRSLVYHYKITHPENSNICPVCLEMFESDDQLKSHEVVHKKKLQSFSCEKCDEKFKRKQQYLIHIKDHEKYKCVTCKESYAALKVALKHATMGHEVLGIKRQLQCAQCGEMFCSRWLFNNHMLEHSGGKILKCEKCKVTFKQERNYLNHLQTKEHLSGEDPKHLFACKECNKTFICKSNLRVHIVRMHAANKKEHFCTFCSYKTTVLGNLKRHVALHTEKPQFICDKCGAQFQTKYGLQEHDTLVHVESRNFSCDKCGLMFSKSSVLNRHLQNFHSSVAQYACHCGSKYKSLYNLQRHQSSSHSTVSTKTKLSKLYSVDTPKLKTPKRKSKHEQAKKQQPKTESVVNSSLLLNSQMLGIPESVADSATMVMMAEDHPQELLDVPYNMDFINQDKSQMVYTQNIDMNSLQVVESMIQLDDPNKQGTSVLINVRNLFGRNLTNDYIMPQSIEPSIVNNLENDIMNNGVNAQIDIMDQKQDEISDLQDYVISHDLNFLNV